jgi:hypothetical protein
MTAADVQNSVGWFIVRSSGNTDPKYTATVDPIDNTTTGNLSFTFDNTSNPRISDLRGLALPSHSTRRFSNSRKPTLPSTKTPGTPPSPSHAQAPQTARLTLTTRPLTARPPTRMITFRNPARFPLQQTKPPRASMCRLSTITSARKAIKTVQVVLTNPYGAAFMMPNSATITITNTNAPTQTNPLDNTDARFFVRQQYLDFLNREPDAGGFDYWSNLITKCAATDAKCINAQRVSVSAAFFIEQEFQDTGSFVYRLYKGSLGRQPAYAEFTADRSRVIGGTNLEASKQTFAENFTQQQEFLQSTRRISPAPSSSTQSC